jgi:hypothetical protein
VVTPARRRDRRGRRAGGVYAGIAQVWVAVAAAALGAVLPTCLDERLRRRELARRRER